MEIKKIDKNQLAKFSAKNKIENIFLSESYMEEFPEVKCFGIFSKDKQLKGVFLLQEFKRLKILKQLSNPVFTPNCQLFYKSEAKNNAKKNTEEKKVIQALVDFLEGRKENIISISFPEKWIDFQPFYWKKYKVITNYTYQIFLNKNEDELFKAMSTERRKNITKAQKDGIKIKRIKPNKEALFLILNTFKKQGVNINEKAIETILFKLSNKSNSFLYMAYNKEGKPIAVNFLLLTGNKLTYMFGGYDETNKHEGAGALAMWASILNAKEKGISIFDFEGSMVAQIENYFRGFGGCLVPYYRVNKASFLTEIILKIKHRVNF